LVFCFSKRSFEGCCAAKSYSFPVDIQVYLSFLFWFFCFSKRSFEGCCAAKSYSFTVDIQVYLSFLLWFFVFQSGALKDVAQQNPVPEMNEVELEKINQDSVFCNLTG
jgi:hypothetical protein